MQSSAMVVVNVLLAASMVSSMAAQTSSNPLSKVIELMDSLTAKITKEGEASASAFHEYSEWCEDFARNKGFEIKTATSQKEALEATIAKAASDIEACSSAISDLAGAIATAEGEVSDATVIREKEHGDFAAKEAELVDAIETLGRAISVLEREMEKNPAALAQVSVSNSASLVQALSVVVDAASFSSADKQKLVALMQSRQEAEEDDGLLGAPAAATYKTHSTSITDVLDDLKEKAEGQLSELRRDETNAKHNFDMLKQSLTDSIAADNKDMAEEKASKSAAEEAKATAEGDLVITTKALADSEAALSAANARCMQAATDHAETVKGREAELKAIADAKAILESSTSGAVEQAYSLFQAASFSSDHARLRSGADLAKAEVLGLVKKLAQEHHSAALAQLASQISAVLTMGSAGGEDPFAKVKTLISEMIERLKAEAASEATEKAYCDETMAKTEAKKEELQTDIAKLTAKIDKAASRSAVLKAEVKQVQGELAALAKLQAEMDKARQDEAASYAEAKADLEEGLNGVRQAIEILSEYYNGETAAFVQQPEPPQPTKHEAASGAGKGIIGILEVVEADFSKNLAEEEAAEASAQDDYDKTTQENKVSTAQKTQDAKYKGQEIVTLDRSIGEMTSDRESFDTELAAVMEFDSKLKDRCVAKPETYASRKARREAEIAGLKQALQILEGEAVFMQRSKRAFRKLSA